MKISISDKRLLDLLFKDSHTSFVLLDRDYNFIRVNESYARACGKAVEFFPGKNHFELYPTNAIDIFEEVKKSKKPFTINARPFVFPDDKGRGVTYWDWNLEPVLDAQGEVEIFVWGIKEVTERVKAEKERDRFFNLSYNLLCTASFDGYFVEISPAWEKRLGYTQNELKCKPFIDYVHPDDRQRTLDEAQRLAEGAGETINFINRYIGKDGNYRWFSWNATSDTELELIYAVAHDITDLKKSEEELFRHRNELEALVEERSRDLASSETRLSYLISNSTAVIYTCGVDSKHAIAFVSDNIANVIGYTPEQYTSDPLFWSRNIHPADTQRVFASFENILTQGTHSDEYRFKSAQGDYIWLHDERRLQRDANGCPLEIVGYWADISKRKEIEANLANAKRDAELANRAKSEFLSNMSHELRTPLNAIVGFSQLLTMGDHGEQVNKSAEAIYRAGHHLHMLINDILDLVKIESGKLPMTIDEVNLNQVIQDCVNLALPMAAERNIRIEDTISSTSHFKIAVDETRFKQVMINLISNGIKYNINYGSVIFGATIRSSDVLRITVTNTGPTISPQNQKKLFKPFERLGADNTEIEGTGIGLVVCKQLIESMNGNIGYYCNQESLSTFWLDIPLLEESADKSPQKAKPAKEPVLQDTVGKCILYIEDNPANSDLVVETLKPAKYRILTASDGKTGIELARAHQPDLILLDIKLPEMDGYDVLKQLKLLDALRHTPVIAVTANATDADIRRGNEAGFNDYITKPFDITKLLATVSEYLSKETSLE